jgi:hypothetical protein
MSFRGSLSLTRYELVIEDLRMLLAKFAYEENFAEDSHGGGRESNMKFIPYLIQMAAHLYKTAITRMPRFHFSWCCRVSHAFIVVVIVVTE